MINFSHDSSAAVFVSLQVRPIIIACTDWNIQQNGTLKSATPTTTSRRDDAAVADANLGTDRPEEEGTLRRSPRITRQRTAAAGGSGMAVVPHERDQFAPEVHTSENPLKKHSVQRTMPKYLSPAG